MCPYPTFSQVSLAAGAVAVAAAVIADVQPVAFWVVTSVNMPAHFGGPAAHQRIEGTGLPGIGSDGRYLVSVGPDNIGKLDGIRPRPHRVFPVG